MPVLPFTQDFFRMEGHASVYEYPADAADTLKYGPLTRESMLLPWGSALPRRVVGAVVQARFPDEELVQQAYGDTSGLIFPLQKRFAHTEYTRKFIHGHDAPLRALCDEIGIGYPVALQNDPVCFAMRTYHDTRGFLVVEGETTVDITRVVDHVAFLRYLQSTNAQGDSALLERVAEAPHTSDKDRAFLKTVPETSEPLTAYAEILAANVRPIVLNAYFSCVRIGDRLIASSYRRLEPSISAELVLHPQGRHSLTASEYASAIQDPYLHSSDLEGILQKETVHALFSPDVSL